MALYYLCDRNIGTEENLQKMIDFDKKNPKITWSTMALTGDEVEFMESYTN